MELLLSIDLGVKTGFAMYGSDGKLLWYRSQNFGNAARLRKAVPKILSEVSDSKSLRKYYRYFADDGKFSAPQKDLTGLQDLLGLNTLTATPIGLFNSLSDFKSLRE
ncbi:MAG: hypothetical protein B6I19_01910 [Bacteroidetes bacterium 4572_114]|nr:MAG: hypothetical protein B6I19_01910 [Bacteroidetes bacterium 4572_114]